MSVPVTAEVLAREKTAARHWTCEVCIWRQANGTYGASVHVTRRGRAIIDVVVADDVELDALSERLELASSAVGAPADLVQGAVAEAWTRADAVGWMPGKDRASAQEATS